MGTVTYEVLREHGTPRLYKKGETRELEEHEARPLVESGTLRKAGEGGEQVGASKAAAVQEEADLVREAKAERAAPQNKAEPVPDFNKTKPRRE